MNAKQDFGLLFDRALIRQRRAKSIAQASPSGLFLQARMADDLCDRLSSVERFFETALVQGNRGSLFQDALRSHPDAAQKIGALYSCDVAPSLAGPGGIVADDELLPFRPASFSLVLSIGTLHGVNDLPGALAQIRATLKPDGLFQASFFGGTTLTELRQALTAAEAEIEGGVSPRIAPFTDVQDGAGLLQRAGFALPVADRDSVNVTYETPLHLLHDLRAMGETNALTERRRTSMRRATLLRALEIYAQRFSLPNGRIKASFEIITLTGWAPHDSQQTPLRPGSAKTRLADALKRQG